MSLTPLSPLGRLDLVRFDLRHGLPCALRVLRQTLSRRDLFRVLSHLLWRGRRDPLASLPLRWSDEQEWLIRRQLRPVVLLDDVLRHDLELEDSDRLTLLRQVVAETGACFVSTNVPTSTPDAWARACPSEREAFATSLVRRFFNVEATTPVVDEHSMTFNVSRCRFAELTTELKRSYLGPMFCEADAVFFARPDVPLVLHRRATITEGADRCDFDFRYR